MFVLLCFLFGLKLSQSSGRRHNYSSSALGLQMSKWSLVMAGSSARESQQEAGRAGTGTQVPFIVLVSGLRISVGN